MTHVIFHMIQGNSFFLCFCDFAAAVFRKWFLLFFNPPCDSHLRIYIYSFTVHIALIIDFKLIITDAHNTFETLTFRTLSAFNALKNIAICCCCWSKTLNSVCVCTCVQVECDKKTYANYALRVGIEPFEQLRCFV